MTWYVSMGPVRDVVLTEANVNRQVMMHDMLRRGAVANPHVLTTPNGRWHFCRVGPPTLTISGTLSPTSPRKAFNDGVAATFATGESGKTFSDLMNCSIRIQAERTSSIPFSREQRSNGDSFQPSTLAIGEGVPDEVHTHLTRRVEPNMSRGCVGGPVTQVHDDKVDGVEN